MTEKVHNGSNGPRGSLVCAAVMWVLGLAAVAGAALGAHGLSLAPARLMAVTAAAVSAFLIALIVKTRVALRTADPDPPEESEKPPLRRTWSVNTQLLLVLLVPSICSAFVLSRAAEELLSEAALRWRSASYGELIESALLDDSSAMPGRLRDLIDGMSGFEQATPFAYFPQHGTAYGLDWHSVSQFKRALTRGRGDQPFNIGGYGFVWRAMADKSGVVGVRFQLDDFSGAWVILFATLLVAVFSSWLIAALGSADLRRWTTALSRTVEAILGDEERAVPRGMPPEIQLVARRLERLAESFGAMPATETAAIASGHRTQEMKAQFFAGMSHDLRSPLNSVIGFTDLLLKGMEGSLNSGQKGAVTFIARESEKLMVLIGDILDTSKLSAGRFELERAWIPSVEILTDCEASARRLIGDRSVDLISEFQPGLPPVFVDKDRIRQALLSLLSRAIDAMDSGALRLKASRFVQGEEGPRWLKVDIIDVNRAIGPAERHRIEQAFSSTGPIRSRSGSEGLSLGIGLASDIVDLHNGELSVLAQESLDTIFTVILPLDEP